MSYTKLCSRVSGLVCKSCNEFDRCEVIFCSLLLSLGSAFGFQVSGARIPLMWNIYLTQCS